MFWILGCFRTNKEQKKKLSGEVLPPELLDGLRVLRNRHTVFVLFEVGITRQTIQ